MSKQGYIKLYRKIEESEFYFCEPFNKTHAWIDLILLANHKDNIIFVRGNEVQIKRGQVAWSKENLAKRWKWSKNKVYRFLEMLNRLEQIDYKTNQQKNNVLGIITIKNYDEYQTTEQQTNQQKDRRRTNRRTTKKNVKNVKNVNTNDLDPKLNEILDIFYKKTKNRSLFANTTQRKALEELIQDTSREEVIETIKYAFANEEEKFCPKISNPIDLQKKYSGIKKFQRDKQEQKRIENPEKFEGNVKINGESTEYYKPRNVTDHKKAMQSLKDAMNTR